MQYFSEVRSQERSRYHPQFRRAVRRDREAIAAYIASLPPRQGSKPPPKKQKPAGAVAQ
jgi:hypothetical protein